jgi:hypothetical protein
VSLQDRLRQAGVNTTIRQNRGRSIAAACGQLAAGSSSIPDGRSAVTLIGSKPSRSTEVRRTELTNAVGEDGNVQGFGDGDEHRA